MFSFASLWCSAALPVMVSWEGGVVVVVEEGDFPDEEADFFVGTVVAVVFGAVVVVVAGDVEGGVRAAVTDWMVTVWAGLVVAGDCLTRDTARLVWAGGRPRITRAGGFAEAKPFTPPGLAGTVGCFADQTTGMAMIPTLAAATIHRHHVTPLDQTIKETFGRPMNDLYGIYLGGVARPSARPCPTSSSVSRFGHLARTDAGRADRKPLGRGPHQNPDPLDVGVPTPLGAAVGVAYAHPERRVLPTYFAHGSHFHSSKAFAPMAIWPKGADDQPG